MLKARKEFILNYAMNRWQLDWKRNVGPLSESIYQADPTSQAQWRDHYYSKIRSEAQIDELGERLYDVIKHTLPDEERFHPALLSSIAKHDCIAYMHALVIDQTYANYFGARVNR